MQAGSKSRLHTKHLAGKMVSSVMLKNDLAQSGAADFRMRFRCTLGFPPDVVFKGSELRIARSELRVQSVLEDECEYENDTLFFPPIPRPRSRPRPRVLFNYTSDTYFCLTSRCRYDSYMTIAPATDALSAATFPVWGMEIKKSQFCLTRARIPFSSPPMTRPIAPVKSA